VDDLLATFNLDLHAFSWRNDGGGGFDECVDGVAQENLVDGEELAGAFGESSNTKIL
jgi:hypothetical protein